ncbi:MAG: hypothetical protein EPO07_19165 [Verrucomicrobia bacterium]|nr:MAG: hypothetical protein EPO07_19165 [Verrucomicrobiota bacterium]
MKLTNRLLITFGASSLALALLSGCALTKDYCSLSYAPQTNVARIKGAEAVKVKIELADRRTIKDKVSVKKNGYGMEMADIISKEDVGVTVKNALVTELTNRGFSPAGGDVLVLAELSKFYNDFKIGFFTGDAVAEVSMNIQVKRNDGSITFSKIVNGNGVNKNVMLASGSNAKVALEAALVDAVAKLFEDVSFTEALLKSAASPKNGT